MIHLYIKTHNTTGLKYFGKTSKDPLKYLGSGKRWLAHLRTHGKNISTEILGSFEDVHQASAVALRFSEDHQIVKSDCWANMIVENAIDGQPVGTKRKPISEDHRRKISEASKKRWADPAYKAQLRLSQQDAWTTERRDQHQGWLKEHWTDDRKRRQRNAIKGTHPRGGTAGIRKSEQHRALIAVANSKPKARCCRIHDRREMSVNAFSRWLNQLPSEETCLKSP